ncbi:conjugal transfer protein TraN, partial [Kosakonia sp. S42]|nr:conjugal transfer protein TraN [Kosakonia sp. S42]
VTKSVFDKYTCERDVWVNQSCKRSATVEVDGSGTTWETQTVEYEMSQQPVQEINGMNIVTIVPTVTGEIVRATYTWSDRLGNK